MTLNLRGGLRTFPANLALCVAPLLQTNIFHDLMSYILLFRVQNMSFWLAWLVPFLITQILKNMYGLVMQSWRAHLNTAKDLSTNSVNQSKKNLMEKSNLRQNLGVRLIQLFKTFKVAFPTNLGTIHILRKHFYSTKLNLASKIFTKTVCFL